eukprot:TRINITY_DN5465_c0_g1_i1.p1 TRINITY_DN5465_c0_g1~~TRINITY_DN5465_c0_g1_i1.p1  ORF type:complete len:229 (-),score=66.62 TRINITY_DN5465_c0_g1_i1:12-698(-)
MDPIRFFREHDANGILSNFWAVDRPLMFEGKEYRTSEHLYQAMKYIAIGNPSPREREYGEKIRLVKTPYMSKIVANHWISGGYKWRLDLNKIIKEYQGYGVKLPELEEEEIVEIMRKTLRIKFTTNRQCKEFLLSTGQRELMEVNEEDDYWSIGTGDGENMLGKLLQEIRKELQDQVKQQKQTKQQQKQVIDLTEEKVKEDKPLLQENKRKRETKPKKAAKSIKLNEQ